jgi:hypothetical protein
MLPSVTPHVDGSSNPSKASLADGAIADVSFAIPPSCSDDLPQPLAKKAHSAQAWVRTNRDRPFCFFMVLVLAPVELRQCLTAPVCAANDCH